MIDPIRFGRSRARIPLSLLCVAVYFWAGLFLAFFHDHDGCLFADASGSVIATLGSPNSHGGAVSSTGVCLACMWAQNVAAPTVAQPIPSVVEPVSAYPLPFHLASPFHLPRYSPSRAPPNLGITRIVDL